MTRRTTPFLAGLSRLTAAWLLAWAMLPLTARAEPDSGATTASAQASAERFLGYEALVRQTHEASIAARQQALRGVVAKEKFWIEGNWGDTLWCLSALYLDEKAGEANRRLKQQASAYAEAMQTSASSTDFRPESTSAQSPWGYFALTDYLRILHLFHQGSPHHPGRLEAETEAAMKEALWWLVKSKSKVADASLDHLLVHHGTENHDLTLRPNYYLAAALFKNDPAFKDRTYDDGHTAAEHYAAYNAYFRAWPAQRIKVGLWFEMGSDTYQKYSWPALFNLHDLSPDAVVRAYFGMLLDVALVEEAQVSIGGRRGGGRSRAKYGANGFEGYKNLLYAPQGVKAQSSHSKVIETSAYQVPAAAILLRYRAFPTHDSFLVYNRVPGELATGKPARDVDDTHNAYVADSALINYAYRTPYYLLGCTLQNPGLSMPNPETGQPVLKYSGISRQNRWSGMLFEHPDADAAGLAAGKQAGGEVCAIYPVVEKTRSGRPQHPHWSFQHKNVLMIQRIAPQRGGMGSYGTGRMSLRFRGTGIVKVEEAGWIFARYGGAFAAVKFLDGEHEWDDSGQIASPVDFTPGSTTRILLHAGDVEGHESFPAFRAAVLANPLRVHRDRIAYRASPEDPMLVAFRYDAENHRRFTLPRVDGTPIDLRPDWTYRSPHLSGRFGEARVVVSVGPIERVYDFESVADNP